VIRQTVLVALLAAAIPGIAASEEAPDLMCVEIASFASAVEPGTTHLVLLRGGWGGDTPNILMTHDCQDFGFEPGNKLCAYLVQNTSWEFGQYNARRAAECLDTPQRERFVRQLAEYRWPAEVTGQLLGASDGTRITIHFEAPKLSQLTLSVSREP
jgi:hypothetical protein